MSRGFRLQCGKVFDQHPISIHKSSKTKSDTIRFTGVTRANEYNPYIEWFKYCYATKQNHGRRRQNYFIPTQQPSSNQQNQNMCNVDKIILFPLITQQPINKNQKTWATLPNNTTIFIF